MGFPKTLEKEEPIVVGKKYRLFLVSSGKNMITSAGILDSYLPRQDQISGT
jgi:hypothetical protein